LKRVVPIKNSIFGILGLLLQMLKFQKLPIENFQYKYVVQGIMNNGEISFLSFLNCLQHSKSVASKAILLNGYFGNKINYLTG